MASRFLKPFICILILTLTQVYSFESTLPSKYRLELFLQDGYINLNHYDVLNSIAKSSKYKSYTNSGFGLRFTYHKNRGQLGYFIGFELLQSGMSEDSCKGSTNALDGCELGKSFRFSSRWSMPVGINYRWLFNFPTPLGLELYTFTGLDPAFIQLNRNLIDSLTLRNADIFIQSTNSFSVGWLLGLGAALNLGHHNFLSLETKARLGRPLIAMVDNNSLTRFDFLIVLSIGGRY